MRHNFRIYSVLTVGFLLVSLMAFKFKRYNQILQQHVGIKVSLIKFTKQSVVPCITDNNMACVYTVREWPLSHGVLTGAPTSHHQVAYISSMHA